MTHERPEGVRRCLESIRALDPAIVPSAVIVIDDGSVQKPVPPLAVQFPDLPLRYEWVPHGGVAAARNSGIALARTPFIAFLADDFSLPHDYLIRARDFFETYPHGKVLTCNVRSVGRGVGVQIQQLYHELVLLQNAGAEPDARGVIETKGLPASRAAIFRRSVFDAVGPFDATLKAGEDGEMGQRLAARGIALHFMHEFYIDHHEGRRFRDFMDQRRRYATSHFRISIATRPRPAAPTWTLGHCCRVVAQKLMAWGPLSVRHHKLMRFLLLWPGLALFLFRFYFTLNRLEAAEAKSTAGAADQPQRTRRAQSNAGD
jgi:GT2 family glycosyltransferase